MRSSGGQHFVGLDHVRALAAFMVVAWHFAHGFTGSPVPFNQAPALGLLDEGHAGVALFMVLSGYLFAKLIDGRRIDFGAFIWNRALRLLPLLLIVILALGFLGGRAKPFDYLRLISGGLVLPILPNGGWSITAEFHFYLVLPFLLWLTARWKWAPLALVAVALLLRIWIASIGEVQYVAYHTIIGRLDQFVLGIFFFHQRVSGRQAAAALIAILAFYATFDRLGGFYNLPVDWPWVFIPTVEGLAFGALIAWYDARPLRWPIMRFVEKAGEYSYSIYLLHVFFVFAAARFVNEHIMALDSLYVALPWALLFFAAMAVIGHFSFKFVESPALKFRKPYIVKAETVPEAPPVALLAGP
jgi:peptidoglycan/LPS O-acetylase OafA/YrhL